MDALRWAQAVGARQARPRAASVDLIWRIHIAVIFVFLAGVSRASDVGRNWGVERRAYADPVTQAQIWELTQPPVTSDNLYFHFSSFTADNRFLLFVSTRASRRELFRATIDSGEIVQLTDDPEIAAATACPDPTDPRRLYYLRGAAVHLMDIVDFSNRRIGVIPPPHAGGFQQPTLSGDGRWLALAKQCDPGHWEIGRMDTRTGQYQTVLTQGFRIGHVQHSPTDPIIFYAWETGGYAPQRSWLVNADGTGNRPFYVRTDPKTWFTPLKEWVTHEAWITATGDMTMINDKIGVMVLNKDGTARLVREGHYWHAAARPDGKRIVADDAQGRLWLIETETANVRLLATGLRDTVKNVHAHPSFDRLGNYVQFHTGRRHETIAIIDLRQLPPVASTHP